MVCAQFYIFLRSIEGITRLSTLGSNGKWPDSEIDYTVGCDARRANWCADTFSIEAALNVYGRPAEEHWQRIREQSFDHVQRI